MRLSLLSASGAHSMANFVVARYVFDDSCEACELTNSEGVRGGVADPRSLPAPGPTAARPAASVTPGTPRATLELESATLITNAGANPYLAPFSLRSGVHVRAEVFPDRGSPRRHLFAAMQVVSVSQEGVVSALQPVTVKLASDGPYWLYRRD